MIDIIFLKYKLFIGTEFYVIFYLHDSNIYSLLLLLLSNFFIDEHKIDFQHASILDRIDSVLEYEHF